MKYSIFNNLVKIAIPLINFWWFSWSLTSSDFSNYLFLWALAAFIGVLINFGSLNIITRKVNINHKLILNALKESISLILLLLFSFLILTLCMTFIIDTSNTLIICLVLFSIAQAMASIANNYGFYLRHMKLENRESIGYLASFVSLTVVIISSPSSITLLQAALYTLLPRLTTLMFFVLITEVKWEFSLQNPLRYFSYGAQAIYAQVLFVLDMSLLKLHAPESVLIQYSFALRLVMVANIVNSIFADLYMVNKNRKLHFGSLRITLPKALIISSLFLIICIFFMERFLFNLIFKDNIIISGFSVYLVLSLIILRSIFSLINLDLTLAGLQDVRTRGNLIALITFVIIFYFVILANLEVNVESTLICLIIAHIIQYLSVLRSWRKLT